ncbi:MAG: ribonuclease HI family protein [Candidatus Omnitrophota bacterium]
MIPSEFQIYIDGASEGNPGPAGIGVILTQNGQVIRNISVYLGIQTNNVAEYMALIFGLQEALMLKAKAVSIYTDSQLLSRQINNEYKLRSPNLIGLYAQVVHLLSAFDSAKVQYIPREENRGADKLAKKAAQKKLFTQAKVATLR